MLYNNFISGLRPNTSAHPTGGAAACQVLSRLTRRLIQSKSLPHPEQDRVFSSGNHFGGVNPTPAAPPPPPPCRAASTPAPICLRLLAGSATAAPTGVEEKLGVGFVVLIFHSFLRLARAGRGQQRANTQPRTAQMSPLYIYGVLTEAYW